MDHNVISANFGNGIVVSGSSRNQIVGNFIGTDASGTLSRGNLLNGILLTDGASNNNVGGTITEQRNVISSNSGDGVLLEQGAHDNTILGNFIGTDVTGLAGPGNGGAGVHADAASNNVIGNTVPVRDVTYYNADLVNPTPNPGWTGTASTPPATTSSQGLREPRPCQGRLPRGTTLPLTPARQPLLSWSR